MTSCPILQRELGAILPQPAFEDILKHHTLTRTSAFNTSLPPSRHNSLIWIRGQDNFIITLESFGRALLYNVFSYNSAMLNLQDENIQKLVLLDLSLLVVSRLNGSRNLCFSTISSKSLSEFKPVRQEILSSLAVKSDEIEEIDMENELISITKNNFIQIWCLKKEKLVFEADKTSTVYSKYSHGNIILCYHIDNNLSIVIQSVEDRKAKNITIAGGRSPYHCEILSNTLLLGIADKDLVLIDLSSFKLTPVGPCKRLYEFEDYPETFALLSDNTGVFLSNPGYRIKCGEVEGNIVNHREKLFLYSKTRKSVLLLTANGGVHTIPLNNRKIEAIGFSRNSSAVYICRNDEISVFD